MVFWFKGYHRPDARNLPERRHIYRQQPTKPLVWITRLAIGAGATEPVTGLGAAPLWTLMRTARNEHPEVRTRLIDLGPGELSALARAVMLDNEPECALRDEQVLVPQMRRIKVSTKPCYE